MPADLDLNYGIRACRDCQLGTLRAERGALAVPPYVGPHYEAGGLALISERPAAIEERTGVPFTGPSGELLDELLDEAGLSRESLVILSRLACAIPRGENTLDYPDALSNCQQWVDKALSTYAPRVVLLLGRPAIQLIFGQEATVNEYHGVSRTTGGITYVGAYHPAVMLRRDANPDTWSWLVTDFRLAAQRLREASG